MKKDNQILYKIKEYIKVLKLDLENLNKESIFTFIKGRKYLISGIVVIITILIISITNSFVVTRDELLKNLEVAMEDGNTKFIKGDVFLVDEKLNKNELEPLVKNYIGETAKIEKVISELKNNDVSGVFSLKSNKKFLKTNYYLELEPVGVKVNCNFENAKIYIDGTEVIASNVKRGLVPGLHKVKAQITSEYGDIEKESDFSLMQNEEVSIKIDAVDLNITSNFKDADVIVNDKNTNKKVSEVHSYGAVPIDAGVQVQLQREFPWGIIKSDKVLVNDLPNINLDINMVNEKLVNEVQVSIEKFYDSVFNSLNKKDYNLIELTDADTKKKIYDEIYKKSFILKNNYEIRDLQTKIENSEFKLENNIYKAQMVVKINYSISKKLWFSSNKEENMILTNMELVRDTWMVKGIQRFNFE